MPLIEYGARWTGQPQEAVRVDRSHPLALALVDAWIGSNPQVTAGDPAIAAGIGRAFGSAGVAATFGAYSSTSIISLPNNDRSRLAGVNGSIVAGVRFGTVGDATFPHIWAVRDGSTQVAIFSGGLNAVAYSGGRVAVAFGGFESIGTSGSLKQNAYAVYGVEFGTNGRKLFVDGAVDSTFAADLVIGSTTIQPALGNRQSGGRSLGPDSELYFVFTFNQNIGDAWQAELARDPWQLFEPQRIAVPFSAGGSAYFLTADQGTYTKTGQAADLLAARLIQADQGAYTVTGQAANLLAARRVAADPGSYAINGQAATLTYTPAGAFSLSADAGSYSLSGQAAALLAARILRSAAGTYAVTGNDAALTYTPVFASYSLTADAGAYALAGQAAAFRRTYVVAADFGAYSVTGQPATLSYSGAVLPAVRASIPTAGGAAFKPRRSPNLSTARRRST